MPNPAKSICSRFELQIQEAMDARLDPTQLDALTIHADSCESCNNVLARYSRLNSILNAAFANDRRCESGPQQVHAFPLHSPGTTSPTAFRADEKRKKQHRYNSITTAAMLLVTMAMTVYLLQSGNGYSTNRSKAGTRVAVRSSVPSAPLNRDLTGDLSTNLVRPTSSFRSIETCFEITAELPGIRPLQSSLSVAFDWLQKSFGGNWFLDQKSGKSSLDLGSMRNDLARRTA